MTIEELKKWLTSDPGDSDPKDRAIRDYKREKIDSEIASVIDLSNELDWPEIVDKMTGIQFKEACAIIEHDFVFTAKQLELIDRAIPWIGRIRTYDSRATAKQELGYIIDNLKLIHKEL